MATEMMPLRINGSFAALAALGLFALTPSPAFTDITASFSDHRGPAANWWARFRVTAPQSASLNRTLFTFTDTATGSVTEVDFDENHDPFALPPLRGDDRDKEARRVNLSGGPDPSRALPGLSILAPAFEAPHGLVAALGAERVQPPGKSLGGLFPLTGTLTGRDVETLLRIPSGLRTGLHILEADRDRNE
jgi:hypothetical protein